MEEAGSVFPRVVEDVVTYNLKFLRGMIMILCSFLMVAMYIIMGKACLYVCVVNYDDVGPEPCITIINPMIDQDGTMVLPFDLGETFQFDLATISDQDEKLSVPLRAAPLYLVDQQQQVVRVTFYKDEDYKVWGVGVQLPSVRHLESYHGRSLELQKWFLFSYPLLVIMLGCAVLIIVGGRVSKVTEATNFTLADCALGY